MNPKDAHRPPRYSNLTALEPDSASLRSFQSNITTPSYATLLPTGHAAAPSQPGECASTISIPSPPRYSSAGLYVDGFVAAPNELVFEIRSGMKAHPWAVLRLHNAQDARKGKHPRFTDEDDICGKVELFLEDTQAIKNIELVLKGTLITSASMDTGRLKFLEHTYTVWDRSHGDPRRHGIPDHKFDGRLKGDWVFPFCIPFPSRVNLVTLRAAPSVIPQPRLQPHLAEPSLVPFHIHTPPLSRAGTRNDRESVAPVTPFRAYDEKGSGNLICRLVDRTLPETHIKPFRLDEDWPDAPMKPPHIAHDSNMHLTPFHIDGVSTNASTSPLSSASDTTITPFILPKNYSATPPPSRAPTKKLRSRWSLLNLKSKAQIALTNGNDENDDKPKTKGSKTNGFVDTPSKKPHRAANSQTFVILPPSFIERGVNANTQYELEFVVTHGRFSSESRVKTKIVYRPETVPPPMALTRQLACQRGISPPALCADPDSWKMVSPVSIKGTYLQRDELNVDYTLYLAKPLSYARSTTIPCCLTIACPDTTALNILASPRSPRVRLRRTVRYLADPTELSVEERNPELASFEPALNAFHVQILVDTTRSKDSNSASKLAEQQRRMSVASRNSRQSVNSSVDATDAGVDGFDTDGPSEGDDEQALWESGGDHERDIARVVWWLPPPDTLGNVGRMRMLQGEIRLPSTLQPTCRSPLFYISYRVELLAPVSHVFEPDLLDSCRPQPTKEDDSQGGHVYASEIVEITNSSRADEPRPAAFTSTPSPEQRLTQGDRIQNDSALEMIHILHGWAGN